MSGFVGRFSGLSGPWLLQAVLLGGGLAFTAASSGTSKNSAQATATIVSPQCTAERPSFLQTKADRYALSCRYGGGTPALAFAKLSGSKSISCPEGTYLHRAVVACEGARFDPALTPSKPKAITKLPTTPEEKAAMARAALEAHNAYRAGLNLTPLAWSDRLAQFAAQWAAHLAKLGGIRMVMSDSKTTGQAENIWLGVAGTPNYAAIIREWGKGRQHDSATLVGCALTRAGGNDIFVCRYWPPAKR